MRGPAGPATALRRPLLGSDCQLDVRSTLDADACADACADAAGAFEADDGRDGRLLAPAASAVLPGAVLLELLRRSTLDAADVRRALDACAGADGAFEVDDVRGGASSRVLGLAPRPLFCPPAVLLELRGRSAPDAADVRRALDACAGADGAFEVDDVRDGRVLACARSAFLLSSAGFGDFEPAARHHGPAAARRAPLAAQRRRLELAKCTPMALDEALQGFGIAGFDVAFVVLGERRGAQTEGLSGRFDVDFEAAPYGSRPASKRGANAAPPALQLAASHVYEIQVRISTADEIFETQEVAMEAAYGRAADNSSLRRPMMRRLLLVASLALASARAPWARRTTTTTASPAAPPSGAAFVASLKAGELRAAARIAAPAYAAWWTHLLEDAPEHVFIETVLICFLAYLFLCGRRAAKAPKLSRREVDELVDDWEPEPLVPALSGAASEIVGRWKVVESADDRGFVTLRGKRRSSTGLASLFSGSEAAPTKLLNCASFDFLGMSGARELEVEVAAFLGVERAIAFSDSASCCTSTVAAFAKRGDLLVVDDGVCEPLRTGCVLSRATVLPYKHNDAGDLERVLAAVAADDAAKGRAPGTQRRFVVCEAVSRDVGDVAPLDELLRLKDAYGYRLILDESLSVGVLGSTGRGIKELFDVADPKAVEITTVDMSPAFGSLGGLCVGTEEVIDHQRLSGAGYCFSAAAPPSTAPRARGARAHPKLTLVSDDANDVPFALLKLSRPREPGADLRALEDLVNALIDRGFCCCVSKYDESVYGRATKNTALPAMRPKPLALKVAVTSKHEPATVDALVAAIVDAAGPRGPAMPA
ncbi:serine palmitoyltransferase [Aureococcus anophagefferens]|nr:serine palmitoyltransferase [Aureococcus anophagefferens]